MKRDGCQDYRRVLLVGDPDVQADRHPDGCAECRAFRDTELASAELLRRNRPAWTASAALRDRVASVIEAERSRHGDVRRPSRRRLFGFAAVLLCAAAAAAVLLAWPRHEGRRRADATADQIVSDYLEYSRRDDKLQVASASPAELEAWFEKDVHLAAKIPALRGATLLGGRHCHLGGRSVALAFYERAGEPISLFVFEPAGEDWSGMEKVAGLPGKRAACRHERRGVSLLVWQERGLAYVVAGALESEELEELVRD